jgi:hypothetical protein
VSAFRHKWYVTLGQHQGQNVERCERCATERTRDPGTRSLYLFRRGRAIPPNKKPMPENWQGYAAGVNPKCAGPEVKNG